MGYQSLDDDQVHSLVGRTGEKTYREQSQNRLPLLPVTLETIVERRERMESLEGNLCPPPPSPTRREGVTKEKQGLAKQFTRGAVDITLGRDLFRKNMVPILFCLVLLFRRQLFLDVGFEVGYLGWAAMAAVAIRVRGGLFVRSRNDDELGFLVLCVDVYCPRSGLCRRGQCSFSLARR